MRFNLINLSSMLIFTALLTACSNTKVTHDYDTNTNFEQLKTYQWDAQPSAAFAKEKPLIHQRIINAIDENMKNKQFTLAESADIKLNYSLIFEKKIKSSNVSFGIGVPVGKHGQINMNSGNRVKQITEGKLDIRMISNTSNTLVWRSTSVKEMDNRKASAEESKKRIGQLIYRMFEGYPPKSK